MKYNIPKIVRPVALTEFAPELIHDDGSPAVVQVWVNPPTARMTHYYDLSREGTAAIVLLKAAEGDKAAAVAEINRVGGELSALFAELWSQHADPATHWTAEEVSALANSDANPALYGWLTGRTIAAIGEYRSRLRKN